MFVNISRYMFAPIYLLHDLSTMEDRPYGCNYVTVSEGITLVL